MRRQGLSFDVVSFSAARRRLRAGSAVAACGPTLREHAPGELWLDLISSRQPLHLGRSVRSGSVWCHGLTRCTGSVCRSTLSASVQPSLTASRVSGGSMWSHCARTCTGRAFCL
eukprot:4824546-Karenia_brevis.AAC.1